jgi:hypothetical protein
VTVSVTQVKASLVIHANKSTGTAAAVTAALGLEPSRSAEFGDPHRSPKLAAAGRVVTASYWIWDEPRTIANDEDPHGMESLVRLAERFAAKSDVLAALSKDFDIRVSMMGLSDSSQGGFVIGPATMRNLATLSASFFADVYLDDPLTLDDLASW